MTFTHALHLTANGESSCNLGGPSHKLRLNIKHPLTFWTLLDNAELSVKIMPHGKLNSHSVGKNLFLCISRIPLNTNRIPSSPQALHTSVSLGTQELCLQLGARSHTEARSSTTHKHMWKIIHRWSCTSCCTGALLYVTQ